MELLVAMSGYISDFVLCTFIDTELSDSDDYLLEVCLRALHTGCYSQPNFIYGLVRCPHFAAHQNLTYHRFHLTTSTFPWSVILLQVFT
jgi:hypothetical protein